MGGQIDGNFLPGSLPHKFILIVTSIICLVVNNFFSLSSLGHGHNVHRVPQKRHQTRASNFNKPDLEGIGAGCGPPLDDGPTQSRYSGQVTPVMETPSPSVVL